MSLSEDAFSSRQNSNDMDLSEKNTVGGFSRKPLVPTSKSAENIFMAERKVKEFMQRVKNRPFKRKVMGIEQIQISRHLPSTVIEGLDGLHREFRDVFADSNRVPKLFNGTCHRIPLKNGFTPQVSARRLRGPETQRYLTLWAQKCFGSLQQCLDAPKR